jgi:antitoxin component YwqK of YwqJK toxin-antitoxin module
MLHLLSNNIIEYVLNAYLDYEEDIEKIKQLYEYKFNIRKHIYIGIDLYPNNNIKRSNIWLDDYGIKDKWYYPDGKLYYLSNTRHGQIHGIQKTWNEEGTLIKEETYDYGRLEGIRKEWYNNGNLACVKNYKNGKLSDIQQMYNN